jgi:KUP system potassium uptake protein
MLNYLGQGAFLLSGQAVIGHNLFFSLVPPAMLIPMVVMACMATIIASQALISGAFSLTAQGIALGLLPRLRIKHTHEEHEGQIYIPFINWALYAGCITLVVAFGSSSRLANAYGLAESGVMIATTLSMIVIANRLWHWRLAIAAALFTPILFVDIGFLTANSLKFLQGGFVPLTIGCSLYVIMSTWQWGRKHWSATLKYHATRSIADVLKQKQDQQFAMDRSLLILTVDQPSTKRDTAPALLELFIKRYHVLPKHIITLTVKQLRKPHVDEKERYIVKEFENDHKKGMSLLSITARFGFMEEPNVEKVIQDIADNERLTPNDDMKDWIIYVGRERILAHKHKDRHNWLTRTRAAFYGLLARNSTPAYEYFGLGEDSRLSAELLPVRIV